MGFPSAHCIRRPYGAMADVKNTPFRRVSLRFYKKLRQSGVFPLIIGMRRSQVSFVLTLFSSEFLTISQKASPATDGLGK